ncbi:50S ribosomal protein L25 [bacterium]|nr:50S ribosomal protein L25 [bacterium]
MLSLTAQIRSEKKRRVKELRRKGLLPGIVYGKGIKTLLLKIPYQDFKKIYQQQGEGMIVNLKVKNEKEKEFFTLIREVQKDPLSEEFIHVDFYQIPKDEEVATVIPLRFEGEAPAEKDLGGVLIKNIHEVKIKALPKDLIFSIRVDLSSLKTFEDVIRIKDLNTPSNVKILANPEEIVALVEKPQEKAETVSKKEESETKETK